MGQTGRFIPWVVAPGRMQMAIDRWLLQQHRLGHQPPTLRFYSWDPVAISLGYHQRRYPDHWADLTWKGSPVDIVRRPTGGRAVLHQGDLTYAVITSGLKGRRLEVYEQLCQFLIEGWRSLGVSLHYGTAGRGYIHNPNCFGTATGADLVLSTGAKLIGSAQLYQSDAVLQHGSMRLHPDPMLFQQVFGSELEPMDLPDPLQSNAELIMDALKAAATRCWGIEFVTQPLTVEEWQMVKSTMQEL